MNRLRDDEIRRLLSHVRSQVSSEHLAEIEDILRSEDGPRYLDSPALLLYFPAVEFTISIDETVWTLRILSHAHLRMVHRGISQGDLAFLFEQLVRGSQARGEPVIVGAYKVTGRTRRRRRITIRAGIDLIESTTPVARVVTVLIGKARPDANGVYVDVG